VPEDAGFRIEPEFDALAQSPAPPRGRLVLAAVALVVALLVGGWTFNWWTVGRFQVATDNAYVRADISRISSRIEGYVLEAPVAENQAVRAGDVIAVIDDTDYQARAAAAEAALAQARGERTAQLAQRAWAQADLARYQRLAERDFLSSARLQQLEIQARQAGAGLASADAAVAAAEAHLRQAQLDLERTIIRSPIDGVIGDRQVQVGQLVRAGTPLMSVVPLQSVYVVANFKETQIAHFHEGLPAIIRPDVAHDLELHGTIQSLAPASGSEFSIIPTDTATGNFTKIVQRVPVRIQLEPDQEGLALLRPGLSATVTVDTRR
jgi:membrane fusion protein (multidrug efflux system)